jgi:hypothetical protein
MWALEHGRWVDVDIDVNFLRPQSLTPEQMVLVPD